MINNNEDEENESDEEEIIDLTPGWTAEDNIDAMSLFSTSLKFEHTKITE